MINNWKRNIAMLTVGALILGAGLVFGTEGDGDWTLVGWNDLGMHCMDDDYSVFSILPPYNTIHAQLIDGSGERVTNPSGISLTYEAVSDSLGSINSTSNGKTNFWQFVQALFGATPGIDEGLAGFDMPGSANNPRPMEWEADFEWFTAEGIPLTPYDDAGAKNYYPMMRLVARNASGTVLATTDIVLPVSDEMDCSRCHASGSVAQAQPLAGWVNDSDPVKDYKRNVIRESNRMLQLPPRLGHPLPQGRHGTRRRQFREPFHPVPELPRQHESGWRFQSAGLV